MLTGNQIETAIRLLCRYEEAWYPRPEAVADIRKYLYWDKKKNCFSIDAGYLLRGEAESVQIFSALEWRFLPTILRDTTDTRNQFDAAVVDCDGEVYFIRKVE